MRRSEIIKYYDQKEILNSISNIAKDREISARLYNDHFTKRPNIIQYAKDIIELVKKGTVSFHTSVERWKNPMELDTSLSKEEMNRLRKGWDLILDIDSAIGIEGAKLAAKRIIELLEDYNIQHYGLKFSGRRGFHIIIPWEAFPSRVDFEKTEKQFPKIPQTIATFIRHKIEGDLLQDLIEYKGSFQKLVKEIEGSISELTPYLFVDVEKDWSKRHLFRMPYSLHEKTWLVSYPLNKEELDSFTKEDAKPENIVTGKPFLKDVEKNEAFDLLVDAMNWESKRAKKRKKRSNEEVSEKKIEPEDPVDEKRFPPCIKLILEGLSDGRKRSVFVLINFLRTMSWGWEKVEEKLEEWNKKNSPPLNENYIKTQIRWFQRQNRDMLPPSCDNDLYYKSYNVCHPDAKCEYVKNPVVYPFKKKKD